MFALMPLAAGTIFPSGLGTDAKNREYQFLSDPLSRMDDE
jgi:hypothetical protein